MTTFDRPALTGQVIKKGRYQIPHPDTGEMTEWMRATNLAATLADKFGLNLWGKAMVVLGMGARHDLYAQAASCSSYDTDKRTLYSLVRQAEDAAEAKAGANLGSALHRFIERITAGETVNAPAPYDQDLDAYEREMDANQLAVLDGWSERILLLPELGIAGTCDMVTTRYDLPTPRITDVKTAKDVIEYGMAEIPLQLAIYSRATHWYDPTTNETHPVDISIDQDKAVVIHLPAGKARCTLYEIDIAAGWEAVQLAVNVIRWRKRRDLATQMISATAWQPRPRLVTADGTVEPPSAPVAPVPSTNSLSTARLHWIQARAQKLVDAGHGRALVTEWPTGVPFFRDGGPRDNDQINEIAAACDRVETANAMATPPFRDGWHNPTQEREPEHEHV